MAATKHGGGGFNPLRGFAWYGINASNASFTSDGLSAGNCVRFGPSIASISCGSNWLMARPGGPRDVMGVASTVMPARPSITHLAEPAFVRMCGFGPLMVTGAVAPGDPLCSYTTKSGVAKKATDTATGLVFAVSYGTHAVGDARSLIPAMILPWRV